MRLRYYEDGTAESCYPRKTKLNYRQLDFIVLMLLCARAIYQDHLKQAEYDTYAKFEQVSLWAVKKEDYFELVIFKLCWTFTVTASVDMGLRLNFKYSQKRYLHVMGTE